MAGARRSCTPARPGERRLHLRASGAPIPRSGSVPSAGGEGGSDRAFCRQGCLHGSSRPSSRRMGPGQPCRATRPPGSPACVVHGSLCLVHCSLRPMRARSVAARAHPTRPQPLLNPSLPPRAESIAQVPLTRSFGCEHSSDPGRTWPLVFDHEVAGDGMAALGFGLQALAALSGRGSFKLGGSDRPG
jgi:hypothetical protein